jgi:hypothetical protein
MTTDRAAVAALLLPLALAAGPLRGDTAPAATRWPATIASADVTFTIYQPQVDRWVDDRLDGRAAVSARRRGESEATIGVVFLRARTSLDRVPGQVTFEALEFEKATFPWERDGGKALLEALRKAELPAATVPLASVNASPALSIAERRAGPPAPRPVEPRVLTPKGPAILVLVDGDYVIRPVPGTKVLRVANTRSLLLQDASTSRFYLPMGSQWLVAPAPNGRWAVAKKVPAGFDEVRKAAVGEPAVETYAHPDGAVDALLRSGRAPEVFVSTVPAVLAGKGPKPAGAAAAAPPRAVRAGELFAGPDGNVYRTLPSGGWEKTNGRDWYPLQSARKKGPPSVFSLDLVSRLDAERRAREAVDGRPTSARPKKP